MVFDSLKYHIFSYIITRYVFVLRSLSKKFINGGRISIVSVVTPKKAEMVPCWEKGGILHLSYLLNESGDPNFFSFFTMCVSWHSTLGSFRKFSFLEQLLMNHLNLTLQRTTKNSLSRAEFELASSVSIDRRSTNWAIKPAGKSSCCVHLLVLKTVSYLLVFLGFPP